MRLLHVASHVLIKKDETQGQMNVGSCSTLAAVLYINFDLTSDSGTY